MTPRTRFLVLLLVVLATVAGALYYFFDLGGTGMTNVPKTPVAKEAAKPATPPPPPAPVKVVAPTKPVSTDPGPTPITMASLKLMPEKTQLAVGLPPLSDILAKTLPIAQKAFKDDLNVKQFVDDQVRDMASAVGIIYDGDATQALKAVGISPDESGAVFADFSALAATAAKSLQEAAPGSPPAMPEFNPEDIKVVLTLPLLDAAKLEEMLKMGLSLLPGTGEPKTEDVGAIKLNVYEGMVTIAYFIADKRLVLGTDLDMIKSCAARVAQPATFRYGTAACPAGDANELVTMIYGRDFIPVIKGLLETASKTQPAVAAMAQAQFAVVEKMFAGETSDDPMLLTFSILNDRVEVRSRMDSATHPGMLDYTGLAEPLRLAPILPDDTMAFLSYRLNEQTKRILQESAGNAIPKDGKNGQKGQQIETYVNQGLSLLGDELTIGIGGLNDLQFPSVYFMLATSKPPTVQMLLGLAQPKLMETYNEVPINQIQAVPFPIPLYETFAGDALVVSNNIAGMKGLIDRAKSKENSKLFASQQPPLDPATPYFTAFLLRSALYRDVLRPVMQAMMPPGTVPEHVDGALVELNGIVRDLRLLAQLDGSWYDTRLVFSLAQEAPADAAPAAPAAPAEPGK